MLHRHGVTVVLAVAVLWSSLAACSEPDRTAVGRGGMPVALSPAGVPVVTTSMPAAAVSISPGSAAAELALGASRTLFERAPIVVVAGESDIAAQARAASFAVALGCPLLLSPQGMPDDGSLAGELERLDAQSVLAVGSPATQWATATGVRRWVAEPGGIVAAPPARVITVGPPVDVEPSVLVGAVAALEATSPAVLRVSAVAGSSSSGTSEVTLPRTESGERLADLVVLAGPEPPWVAATATAVAAGADVQVIQGRDPRESSEAIAAISARGRIAVVGLGDEFGPLERLAEQVAVAATGVELPGGGQLMFPGRRLVSLYGTPGTASLGVLGEQDLEAAIVRAREVAATYDGVSSEPVVPAFEIITTVASGAAGDDGDYSYEADLAEIERWVTAARDADIYVVLDLQPGRTDFLSQAKRYEELLIQPHVGLALDPEWRLEPDQVHLRQIGAVSAQEVNTVVTWLADLVAENDLPQKLLLLHQFRNSMITDRDQVDTGRGELAVLVHADGYGTPELKLESWRNLRLDGADRFWWGWKNFYDEDTPTMTPAQTLAVDPAPVFVSYQ